MRAVSTCMSCTFVVLSRRHVPCKFFCGMLTLRTFGGPCGVPLCACWVSAHQPHSMCLCSEPLTAEQAERGEQLAKEYTRMMWKRNNLREKVRRKLLFLVASGV